MLSLGRRHEHAALFRRKLHGRSSPDPEPSGHPDTVEKLEAELEYFAIADALVCHARAVERNLDLGNQTIIEELANHDSLHPAWVIPMHTAIDYPEPERFVDEMIRAGVRAVRVWPPPYHGYLADGWALGPLWQALSERRVPVLVGASDLGRYPDQPGHGFSARNLYDICRAYPSLPVVVMRLNFSALRVGVPLLRDVPTSAPSSRSSRPTAASSFFAATLGRNGCCTAQAFPWKPWSGHHGDSVRVDLG